MQICSRCLDLNIRAAKQFQYAIFNSAEELDMLEVKTLISGIQRKHLWG